MVLETVATVRPASEMMSPALASSTGTRSSPRKAMIFDARPVSTTLPSLSSAWIGWLTLTVPDCDAAGQDAAEEVVAVEQRDEELERTVDVERRARAHGSTIFSNSGVSVPSRASGSSLA